MRIGEALGEVKPLEVKFGTAVLNVTYRPPAYTVAQIEEASADRKNPDRLITMIQSIVVSWDLEDNTGEPIDLGNVEQMKQHVPLPVYNGIIRAVQEDQGVGEA